MNTILVPTDFSPCAANALRVAALIARKSNAEIHLLHSVQTDIDWTHLPVDKRSHYPEILAKLDTAEKHLENEQWKSVLKGLKIHTHLSCGIIYDEIVHFANKKIKADLIVMGSHGRDEPNEIFIGSNTQKTIRLANCPVLTIKKSFKGRTFKKILFASDFSEKMNEPFRKIQDVATAVSAKIEIVFVHTPNEIRSDEAIQQVIDSFITRYPDIKFSKAIQDNEMPEKGILDYSQLAKPDMISLLTHGNRHVPHYLLGVTETLAYHSSYPVLSMNIK